MSETLRSICDEFWGKVKDCYIFYLDVFKGLEFLREDTIGRQNALIEQLAKTDPEIATVEYTDGSCVPYMMEIEDPKQPEVPPELRNLIETTVGELKKRNSESGQNFRSLGNLCIVAFYSWWEDEYRGRLASYLGRSKNEISAPVFGDLCKLRNAIVHNNGIATTDVEKAELLRWFKRGEPILLTFERLERIMSEMKKSLARFYTDAITLKDSSDEKRK